MPNCCSCNLPQPDSCRQTITSADLAELLYIQGLDENLCKKFQEVAELVGFVDCLGAPIAAGAQIVTCAQFPARLCLAIATLAAGPTAVPGVTALVGADCLTHVLPTLCAQITALASGPAITLGVTEVVTENCQLAVVPETPITVVDTLTVDLTVGGPFSHTLQADVRISAIADNCLVIQADGLYAACPEDPVDVCGEIQDFPVGAPGVPGVTQFVGADCQLHALPNVTGEVAITGLDGDCVNVTVIEVTPNNFTIEAEAIISPNADNALSCVGNGLFVNEVNISAGDSDCVVTQVTDNGNGDWTIVSDAVISPDFGNALECRENGLYSNQVGLVAADSDCIALVLVGDTLTAEPIISVAAGNAITCTAGGLFVEAGAGVTVVALDTDTVDTTVTETPAGTFTVSSEVIISPNPGNTIIDDGDGIYSSGAGIAVADTNCINLTLAASTITADPILASIYPGYAVAGSNSLECTATGLTAPPEGTAIYQVDTDNPAPGVINNDSIPVIISTVNAAITNTSLYRNMVVILDFTAPQFGLTTAVPSAGTNVQLTSDFSGVFPEGPVTQAVNILSIAGSTPAGFATWGGGGPLCFSQTLMTLLPGETITATLEFSLTNIGSQPENYDVGNAGIRLFGVSV